MKKLFVGNLPYQASESELRDWFTDSGFQADSVAIIKDRLSGEPRGFGFVEIADDTEADRAIEACNGQSFLGRALVVNEARPMTERPPMRARASDGERRRSASAFAGGGRQRRDR